jgi:hypothetical protein
MKVLVAGASGAIARRDHLAHVVLLPQRDCREHGVDECGEQLVEARHALADGEVGCRRRGSTSAPRTARRNRREEVHEHAQRASGRGCGVRRPRA